MAAAEKFSSVATAVLAGSQLFSLRSFIPIDSSRFFISHISTLRVMDTKSFDRST